MSDDEIKKNPSIHILLLIHTSMQQTLPAFIFVCTQSQMGSMAVGIFFHLS